MRVFVGVLLLATVPAAADTSGADTVPTLEAVRTIRPGEIIAPADVRIVASGPTGGLSSAEQAVGMAARRLLATGRPLMAGDIGPPMLVSRNSLVPLVFVRGGLTIRTEGRALGNGAEGERVRVMNLASRQTVTGTVAADGSVAAGDGQ
jgi:flagella basal body P-ring formation protein FlgA